MIRTVAEEVATFAGFQDIISTLQLYIDGARAGDDALLREAFLPNARIQGAYGGKPVDWTREEFCGVVTKGGPAPELAARIVAIDVAGAAGAARIEIINWRQTRYTDFFVLLNNGGWRIAGKVFFAHSRA